MEEEGWELGSSESCAEGSGTAAVEGVEEEGTDKLCVNVGLIVGANVGCEDGGEDGILDGWFDDG